MAKPKAKKLKCTLVSTPLAESKLLATLRGWVSSDTPLGFDVETVAPALRNRKSDFGNIMYAKLLGFSIGHPDGMGYYVSLRHPGSNCSFYTAERVVEMLRYAAEQKRLWAHNAGYEHQALYQEYGFTFEGLRCSQAAAWLATGENEGLGLKRLADKVLGRQSPPYEHLAGKKAAEVVQYAVHDAINTVQLGQFFTKDWNKAQWDWFDEECYFTQILAEMKLRGIGLDIPALEQAARDCDIEGEELLAKWAELSPKVKDGDTFRPLSITSNKDLQVLFQQGLWRSKSTTKTGAHSITALTMSVQEEMGAPPQGVELAKLRTAYQEVNKIKGTYTLGLVEEAKQFPDLRLHPDLHHFGTVTGRLSSANPNIQNQPAHGTWAKRIKASYIPSPGCVFTSSDYSQIELRFFAEMCGGPLLEAFERGEDLHQMTADACGVERSIGKTINFGFLLYGGGPPKMADLLKCSVQDAAKVVARLQAKFPQIEQLRAGILETVKKRPGIPYVDTIQGRRRYILELDPELYLAQMSLDDQRKLWRDFAATYRLPRQFDRERLAKIIYSRGKRLVVNTIIQGGSRDILVMAMNKYRRTAPDGFVLVTTVHDEILTEHPIGKEDDGQAILKYSMESIGKDLGFRVPLIAEPSSGPNWAAVK